MLSDVLSEVLRGLRAEGTVYFCDQLSPPWEKRYSGDDGASFHQIRRGGCRLEAGDRVEYLGPGDLIFLAPGLAHVLSSEPQAKEAPTDSAETLLLCGYCTFNNVENSPFSKLFPELIIIRAEQLERLGWLQSPLIKALTDQYISKALERLHQAPEKKWSLEILATDIGLSRAAFAKRFKLLVGVPMFDYLTHLRIQQACQLLTETDMPLYKIANRVGYESDLAFTRTFKNRLGLTPTAYRKSTGQKT